MDVMFSHHIGKNLEISVDDMTWKTAEGCNHAADLKDDLQSVKTYNLLLNPTKFSFRVQVGKFLGFMMINIGIEAIHINFRLSSI